MEIPKLYKYRFFNENIVTRFGLPNGELVPQWQQVLYDGLIFPANPASFNDPYDCDFLLNKDFLDSSIVREVIIQQLSQRCSLMQQEKDAIIMSKDINKTIKSVLFNHFKIRSKDIAKYMFEDVSKAIKSSKSILQVACFSEVNDSILMWSHYAQNHQGFCIEYDFTNWESKKHLKPVTYIKDRHFLQGECFDDEIVNIGTHIIREALYKADVWSYEKEWRIIFTQPSVAHPEYNGRTLAFLLKELITGVYLGAQTEENYIQKICEHFSMTKVHIYQMQMRSDKYELVATQLQ